METKVGEQSLQKLAKTINGAENTKIAIIEVARFEELLAKAKEALRVATEKAKKVVRKVGTILKINPKEVPMLVSRENIGEDDQTVLFNTENTEEEQGRIN